MFFLFLKKPQELVFEWRRGKVDTEGIRGHPIQRNVSENESVSHSVESDSF